MPSTYSCSCFACSKVVLIGGEKGDDIPLKQVIMFDTMSEKCTMLPSMNHARRGCSAVIAGDLIVMMGGYGKKGRLRSVVCYDVNKKTWRDLPPMIDSARAHVTAVVRPKV